MPEINSKVIQLVASKNSIFLLCEDGSIWERSVLEAPYVTIHWTCILGAPSKK